MNFGISPVRRARRVHGMGNRIGPFKELLEKRPGKYRDFKHIKSRKINTLRTHANASNAYQIYNIYMYLFSKFRFILFTSFVFARGRTNLVPSVFAKDSFPSQTFVLESATPCPAEDDTNSSTRKSICWRSLPFAWKLPAQPCVQGTTLTTVSIRLSFIKS